jgi:tetratricopeptide (TPR) repeat protein
MSRAWQSILTNLDRARPSIFTILALGMVFGAVRWAMCFLLHRLQLPMSLWEIPVFGGAGGVVGSLMENEKQIYLVTFESSLVTSVDASRLARFLPTIQMGIVADVIMGLAGSVSAVFLFHKTLDLKFESQDASAAIVVIGVTLIAGVFGRKIILMAGDKLTKEDVKDLAKKEALAVGGTSRAQSLTQDAEDNIKKGVYIDRALEMSQAAIEADPKYLKAYITKGRALKRLKRLGEAFDVMNQALVVQPDYPYALYNRACYGALLGHPPDKVLTDLEQAIKALPKFAVIADTEEDLTSVQGVPRFAELILQGATRAIEADSGYLEGYIAKADALARLQRLDEALAVINQALQIKASNANALYKRASYLARLGQPKENVLRDLAAALKLAPALAESARKDAAFASLSGTPEFTALLDARGGS